MNIYCYRDNQQLIASLNSTQVVLQYNWFLRDVIPISLVLVTKQANISQPYAVAALNAGESIQFGAKAAYADATYLFSQNTWTAEGTGPTQKYTASINLNTTELIAAMAAVDTLTVKAEFTFVQPDNSNALTTQFLIKVTRDVIIGTEGTPTSEFPVIQQFTDLDGVAKVRLVNSLGQTVFVGAPL